MSSPLPITVSEEPNYFGKGQTASLKRVPEIPIGPTNHPAGWLSACPAQAFVPYRFATSVPSPSQPSDSRNPAAPLKYFINHGSPHHAHQLRKPAQNTDFFGNFTMRCRSFALALAAAYQIEAASLSISGSNAISASASTLASNLMSYYNPANVGVLPAPYYWWEAGGMWGAMLDYWHYTGDSQYNDAVAQAIISQAGSRDDFVGPYTQGNDDQGWWGLAAMSAAEYGLPSPAGAPSWLSLAQNVFSDMHERWDTTSCNGGLKWQIFTGSPGYDYKNSISNGLYFQLGARLAKLTGSPEYITEATQAFEWVQSVGLIDDRYNVYDGTDDTKGCTSVDHDQYSYNVGVYLYGSAVMQALTNDPKWVTRTNGLLGATSTFFQGNVMAEKCEQAGTCNVDQLSFKSYLSRWLAATSVLLPSTASTITPLLQASANGAVASCAGGPDSATCGTKWFTNDWDGTQGVGQQLAALEVVHGLLAGSAPAHAKRGIEQQFRA